ncbi:hypothetical protein VTI74DRAFT_10577 [Chaetomium olivicolor]
MLSSMPGVYSQVDMDAKHCTGPFVAINSTGYNLAQKNLVKHAGYIVYVKIVKLNLMVISLRRSLPVGLVFVQANKQRLNPAPCPRTPKRISQVLVSSLHNACRWSSTPRVRSFLSSITLLPCSSAPSTPYTSPRPLRPYHRSPSPPPPPPPPHRLNRILPLFSR